VGGVLGDLGCHILDLTTAVAGEVQARALAPSATAEDPRRRWALTAWNQAEGRRQRHRADRARIHQRRPRHRPHQPLGHRRRGNTIRVEAHGTGGALCSTSTQLRTARHYDLKERKWSTATLPAAPDIYHRFAPPSPPQARPAGHRPRAQIQAYLDACDRSAKSGKWEKVKAWN